jgi:uncharacterized repeat protein (TIGR03803 family)
MGCNPNAAIRGWSANLVRITLAASAIALFAALAQVAAAQEVILYDFKGTNSSDGSVPVGLLVADSAGNLYGATNSGGAVDAPQDTSGTVYELSPAGGGKWTEKVLYNFGIHRGDGIQPAAGLIFDGKGNLYGTTHLGGANGAGMVFELTPGTSDEWNESVLYSFGATSTDGAEPYAGLILDSKGNLYGTTKLGGTNTVSNGLGVQKAGTVFELSPLAGGKWKEKVLYNFGASTVDAANSAAGVIFDSAGNLYGTTTYGGKFNSGTVFTLTHEATGTWKETVLHSFDDNGVDGSLPSAGLIFDSQGNLYGTTYGGGSNPSFGGLGAVYELSPAPAGEWTEQVLFSFGGLDGDYPLSSLVLDAAGNLYGTASSQLYGFGSVFELTPSASGWTKETVYAFGDTPDGYAPPAGVIFDDRGNLYGITSTGGSEMADFGLGGTAYEIPAVTAAGPTISPAGGTYTVAQKVTIADSTPKAVIYYTTDGSVPTISSTKYTKPLEVSESATVNAIAVAKGLPQSFVASATYLIGKTAAAPVFSLASGFYPTAQAVTITDATHGATFHYAINGTVPTVESPKYTAPITVSSDETVSAIAVVSGYADSVVATAVYAIEQAALPLEKILYSFGANAKDGGGPVSGLIADAKGNLYGTTEYGGPNMVEQGNTMVTAGTVFELTPESNGGWTEKVLYDFGANSTDGSNPMGGVVMDAKGNLYGTTSQGGAVDDGTVFELTLGANGTWKETIIHNFFYLTNDGKTPEAGLVIDAKGNLYGTTNMGGANSEGSSGPGGTVFELSPEAKSTWKETLLHSFNYLGQKDGYYPVGPIIFDTKGNIYGTTSDGGAAQDQQGGGTVFELSPVGTGWKETILASFGGGKDTTGYQPLGCLAIDAAGNVYGTNYSGGPDGFGLDGSLFEISPSGSSWTTKVLHSFGSNETDGINPYGGLILDKSGNLYGTTGAGGANGDGTVFKLSTANGSEEVLHDFNLNGIDGVKPHSQLFLDATGNLYGTTAEGGKHGADTGIKGGTVFEIVSSTTTQKPLFSLAAGTYASEQKVAITDATAGAAIYYTTNGANPTAASTRYTSEITVLKTVTIKAIAIAKSLANSPIAEAAYKIGTPTTAQASETANAAAE